MPHREGNLLDASITRLMNTWISQKVLESAILVQSPVNNNSGFGYSLYKLKL